MQERRTEERARTLRRAEPDASFQLREGARTTPAPSPARRALPDQPARTATVPDDKAGSSVRKNARDAQTPARPSARRSRRRGTKSREGLCCCLDEAFATILAGAQTKKRAPHARPSSS